MYVVHVTICFVVLLRILVQTQEPYCAPAYSYQGHLLTVQWPISYCNKRRNGCNLRRPVHRWTIHGFWPQFNRTKSEVINSITGSRQPEYCCHPQRYDPILLEPIANELIKYWPTLDVNEDHHRFWSHQWNKHGVCFRDSHQHNQPIMIERYFSIVLQIYRQFPITKWLYKFGIIPSNTISYDQAYIHRALESGLGQKGVFRLDCDLYGPGMSILSEIQICFNKKLEPIPCEQLWLRQPPDGLEKSVVTVDDHNCLNKLMLLEF